MDKRLFFNITQKAVDRLTFAMSEYSAAIVSLGYMRQQTHLAIQQKAEVSDSELRARFASGSTIHWQNFIGASINTSWEQHEQFFSWALLGASISTFEGWVADIGTVFGFDKQTKTNLQVPELFQSVVSQVQIEHPSASMKSAFYEAYGRAPKCRYPAMASMLHCFRVFKEMRNAFMHSGGQASERLVQRLSEYQRICTLTTLRVNEVPVVNPCAVGDTVVPVYRGIIGFTDILIRILVSYDSELLCTTYGESEFLQRYNQAKYTSQLSGLSKQKAGVIIGKGVKRAGFRNPKDMESLRRLIVSKLP